MISVTVWSAAGFLSGGNRHQCCDSPRKVLSTTMILLTPMRLKFVSLHTSMSTPPSHPCSQQKASLFWDVHELLWGHLLWSSASLSSLLFCFCPWSFPSLSFCAISSPKSDLRAARSPLPFPRIHQWNSILNLVVCPPSCTSKYGSRKMNRDQYSSVWDINHPWLPGPDALHSGVACISCWFCCHRAFPVFMLSSSPWRVCLTLVSVKTIPRDKFVELSALSFRSRVYFSTSTSSLASFQFWGCSSFGSKFF